MTRSTDLFMRLTGRGLHVRPLLTVVQTKGSFRLSNGAATVAARITRARRLVDESVSPLYNIASSAEAEWASVYYGLLLARANKETFVGVENERVDVVMSLLIGPPREHRPYVDYYTKKIMDVAEGMEWCGIRWISREENGASRMMSPSRV